MLAAWLLAARAALGQMEPFAGAPPGINESGTAAFVVLAPEALGLSAPPTDLRQMPDGRILVVARTELALGDGIRWEVFRQADSEPANDTVSVAVDNAGRIYAGVTGGLGRIDFGSDGRWRLHAAAQLDGTDAKVAHPVCTEVGVTDSGWYWHSGSGTVTEWRPGTTPQTVANADSIEHIFVLGSEVFISSRSDGSLLRVSGREVSQVTTEAPPTPNDTITCSTPFDGHQVLVGTSAKGLKLFDGHRFTAFPSPSLPPGLRINDLCGTAGGYFAAAIDNTGIVLLDDAGNVVQTVDRSLDHRFSRVRRLFYAAGSLWALLNDGIARIRFPSRLSNFEPLVSTGLTYAQPIRYDGRLWLLSDGRAQRGIYSPDGRLLRFADDSPPGTFVYNLSTQFGPLVASNENGIYQRIEDRWRLILPDIVNAHLDIPSPDGLHWFYIARNELGWIERNADTYSAHRYSHSEMGEIYGIAQDASGRIWLELGASRIGLVLPEFPTPVLQIFTTRDGVADGWVNTFVLDGQAYFNIANHLFRFDEKSRRFAPETALLRRYPVMAGLVGRPARDASGRLWVTAGGAVHLIAENRDGPPRDTILHAGSQPYLFYTEHDGVVWMFETHRLIRYDPTVPEPPPSPLHALVTQVHLVSSDQHRFELPERLEPLPYADNSLAFHYVAVGAPFGQTITFEVKLDGSGGDWVSTGSTGSAAFNRLKEGQYTLHVRPRTTTSIGTEATLGFTIRPPWYRTPVAYVLYILATLATLLGGASWLSYLERRENARLEILVKQRTHELHEANTQLGRQMHETLEKASALSASEDRYRRLNEELEHRVEDRTAELSASNRELESFSYSISHDLRAPLRNISGFADLLRKRLRNTDAESDRFLSIIATESVRLGQLIDALLVFSRLSRSELKLQPVDLSILVDQARNDQIAEINQRAIELHVAPLPHIMGDPTLLRQVFTNLLSNAIKFTRDRKPAVIEIGTATSERPGEHVVFVRDNGVGFDPKYTDKLFGVFQRLHHMREFEGTGIGLANVRRIIARHGGRVWAEGRLGQGATFYVALRSSDNRPV